MSISAINIGASAMHRAADRFEASANRVARFGTGLGGEVDLATEMVDVMMAETDFKAATKIVRVADEMAGSLLDILA
ncbi:MAG TPA: flagellar basal body rod C-terminal domain-containing protein [Devosia sp.]|nr:flagellar basal body rod C-terminal domain-containing protein [Devosia sp.]